MMDGMDGTQGDFRRHAVGENAKRSVGPGETSNSVMVGGVALLPSQKVCGSLNFLRGDLKHCLSVSDLERVSLGTRSQEVTTPGWLPLAVQVNRRRPRARRSPRASRRPRAAGRSGVRRRSVDGADMGEAQN